MALKPKTALLQVRLDPDLLARYQAFAEDHHMTVSEAVRRQMIGTCERHESIQERNRLKALRSVFQSTEGVDTKTAQKMAQTVIKRVQKGGK